MAKKKKKKEEFDAALMGGYLPGALPTTSSKNVNYALLLWKMRTHLQLLDVYLADQHDLMPVYQVPYEHQTTMARAWFEYTGIPSAVEGGYLPLTLQLVAQSPQAYMGYSLGVYGTFLSGLALEVVIGTAAVATVLTLVDPAHKYPGGTDELMRGVVHPKAPKEILLGMGSWGSVT